MKSEILLSRLSELCGRNASVAARELDEYSLMIREASVKMNLTAVTDEAGIEIKHFLDSLAAAEFIPSSARVLDLGCGAGLPGIPLAIAGRDLNFVELDSVGKKVAFVSEAISRLSLNSRVTALHSRVEDLPKDKPFDVVVSRAVAELRVLVEYALPFLKVGGRFIAYKSLKTHDEIDAAANALSVLNAHVSDIKDFSYSFGGEDFTRSLVIVEKDAPSLPRYPRPKNQPRLKPL